MITQTEILTLAIRAVDADIESWRIKCEKGGEEGQKIFEMSTADMRIKRRLLCELYFIQTGNTYE